METILHFDKLFYHFSHSGVTGRKYRNRKEKRGKKKTLKIVRGDKGRATGEIAFYLNLISRNSSFFALPVCAVHMINRFVFLQIFGSEKKLVFLSLGSNLARGKD
jgi:hypothetical protein